MCLSAKINICIFDWFYLLYYVNTNKKNDKTDYKNSIHINKQSSAPTSTYVSISSIQIRECRFFHIVFEETDLKCRKMKSRK